MLPAETLDHGHRDAWTEDEMDQMPGTSYGNVEANSNFAYTESGRKGKGEYEGSRGRERASMNCSSGGAHMLACFRAGAINLVRARLFLLLLFCTCLHLEIVFRGLKGKLVCTL